MKNIVNLLTLSRILTAPVILIFLIFGNYLVSLLLFFFAGITDYFDGYFARKYGLESQIGEILDPVADKILIIFILFGLSVNLGSYLIAFFGSIILSREIGVTALRDYCSRNNLLGKTKVTFLAKTKTTVQLFTITLYLISLSFKFYFLVLVADIFLIISALITLYTGYEYALNVFKK